jgi:hypothetical protein
MEMIGNIAQPHKPITPKSGEIELALNLLTAVGGGDPKVRKYLTDLKAALSHNDRVAVEANHALAKLGDLQAREKAIAKREHDTEVQIAEVKASTEHNVRLEAEAAEKIRLLGDLETRAAKVSERENAVAAKVAKLDQVLVELKA